MAVAPAINVFAAPEDIIDTTKKASLTIHKYDMTAAQQDGINVDEFKDNANGKQDATAETTFADYVIKGVEFTYAKVGEINTESINGKVEVDSHISLVYKTFGNLICKVILCKICCFTCNLRKVGYQDIINLVTFGNSCCIVILCL